MKTHSHPRTRILAMLVAAIAITLQGTGLALTVTNNKDNAPSAPLIAGSLRWAIAGTPANGTVDFSTSLKGKTIILTDGQLVVTKALTIRGLGCDKLAVSGNNKSRVFYVGGSSTGSGAAIISDMTITKGNGRGGEPAGTGDSDPSNDLNGGGIYNSGFLQLLRVCVTGNTSAASGGGVYNRGSLSSMVDSTVSYNTALLDGGGLQDDTDMTIFRCAVINNAATLNGGGIRAGSTNPDSLSAGTVNLINSTVASNRATGNGGGIDAGTGITLFSYNVTVSGNSAANGGGIASAEFPGSSWSLRNTIVATNTAPVGPDIANNLIFPATFSAAGNSNNLIGNTSGSSPATAFNGSDILGQNPKLGPLQNNGGPTQTQALLPGSPAIDTGYNPNIYLPDLDPGLAASIMPPLKTDQRVFMTRVINGGTSNTVDIGAYEYTPARALKYEAISDLTPCLSSTDCRTVANARSAIRSIQCSLASRLWVNDTKLTCSGELVFEYEEEAAYAIQKILKYSPDLACVQAALDAVQDLMQADEQIARAAISEASACNGNASYIAKANCELVAAQTSIAKQDYKGAIEHYEHAWDYAQKACNRCRNDDDCRRDREDTDREDRDRWGDDDRCGGDHDEHGD